MSCEIQQGSTVVISLSLNPTNSIVGFKSIVVGIYCNIPRGRQVVDVSTPSLHTTDVLVKIRPLLGRELGRLEPHQLGNLFLEE